MPGKLPGARPTSASYGQDVVDDRPVEDASRETSATNWNDLKTDAAYAARMAPLLRIRVTNNGSTAAVAAVLGPEGVVVGNVTATRTGAGTVTVDITATGVSAFSWHPKARHATASRLSAPSGETATGATIRTFGTDGSLADCDFDLVIY